MRRRMHPLPTDLKTHPILSAETSSRQLLLMRSPHYRYGFAASPRVSRAPTPPASGRPDCSFTGMADLSFPSASPESAPTLTLDPSHLMNSSWSASINEIIPPSPPEESDSLSMDMPFTDPQIEHYDFQQAMLFDFDYLAGGDLTGQQIASESSSSQTILICHIHGCKYMSFSLSHYRLAAESSTPHSIC